METLDKPLRPGLEEGESSRKALNCLSMVGDWLGTIGQVFNYYLAANIKSKKAGSRKIRVATRVSKVSLED